MNQDYANAYSEVLEVLKYIPKEDFEKIPKKIITLLEQNKNGQSNFVYNAGVSFEKQAISKDAKTILAILYRNCWATQEEKHAIQQREKERLVNIEKEKRKTYNAEDIFKKKEKNTIQELKENHYLMLELKWYQKIFQKIRDWFRIGKNRKGRK